MAITKTNFIEYTRCDRYVALEDIRESVLQRTISYQEYKKEEENQKLKEIFDAMFDTDSSFDVIDKTRKGNPQLEAMNPYYKRVELEAGRLAEDSFPGKVVYAEKTSDQKCFSCVYKDVLFLCYVDIYSEADDVSIIEVKATTSKKYLELMGGYYRKEKYSIFSRKGNIYQLKGESE